LFEPRLQAAYNGWGVLAQAIWTKQCKHSVCHDTVTALAAQMGDRARQIVKASPNLTPLAVTQLVNRNSSPNSSRRWTIRSFATPPNNPSRLSASSTS
jgi:hypothetical protein